METRTEIDETRVTLEKWEKRLSKNKPKKQIRKKNNSKEKKTHTINKNSDGSSKSSVPKKSLKKAKPDKQSFIKNLFLNLNSFDKAILTVIGIFSLPCLYKYLTNKSSDSYENPDEWDN